MSSLEKKTKKRSSKVTPNPSLPDDLLLSCFARVSRLYYPTLSLVSKSCRSLVASPELYKTRSFLNHTESCFYVCLEFPDEPNQRWFTLCRKPNQTLTKKKKSSGYVLVPVPVPVPNSPTMHCKGLVAVGSNIYAIGGSIRNEYSSSVSILDCRSHTWHEAPRMRIERNCAAANVVDGRIYVAGGSQDFNDSNWMEVFDTKTQTWELVVSPLTERCMTRIYNSAVSLLFSSHTTVKLAACGGKLVVLWDKYVPASGNKEKMIWCAEISLERHNSKEIWGKVEWLDAVLTVPKSYEFVGALAATI